MVGSSNNFSRSKYFFMKKRKERERERDRVSSSVAVNATKNKKGDGRGGGELEASTSGQQRGITEFFKRKKADVDKDGDKPEDEDKSCKRRKKSATLAAFACNGDGNGKAGARAADKNYAPNIDYLRSYDSRPFDPDVDVQSVGERTSTTLETTKPTPLEKQVLYLCIHGIVHMLK